MCMILQADISVDEHKKKFSQLQWSDQKDFDQLWLFGHNDNISNKVISAPLSTS